MHLRPDLLHADLVPARVRKEVQEQDRGGDLRHRAGVCGGRQRRGGEGRRGVGREEQGG